MKLRTDWKRILRHAWSVRLIALAGALNALEAVLPMFSDSVPRGMFAALSLLVGAAAMVARVTQQKNMQ